MRGKSPILVVILLTLLGTLLPTSHYVRANEAPPPFNLDLDANSDGIPDELASAVAVIGKVITLAQDDGTLSSDEMNVIDQELSAFDARLPYNSNTRTLQQQVAALQAELQEATPEQAESINAEILRLSEQMFDDPNYARTISALTKLLAPDLAVAMATKHQVFLPLTMKGIGSGAVLTEGAGDGASLAASKNLSTAWWNRPRVSWTNLRRGDIMFVNAGNKVNNFAYVLEYNHVGTFDGSGRVYESNPNDGVNMRRLATWQQADLYVGLGRNNGKSASEVERALNWAKGRYGDNGRTPYNWFFPNKWTDNALYCSQLIWKIHKYIGIDLDSNDALYAVWFVARWGQFVIQIWRHPIPGIIGAVTAAAIVIAMVAPDEIARSRHITIYSKGWTN